MSRHPLRLAALTAALTLTTLSPAHADDTPPPVAVDDAVTTQARTAEFGGVTFIDVLGNDESPSGAELEICRVRGPQRGLSVAEVAPDGSFDIETPGEGYGAGNSHGGPAAPGARESLVVLPWANRAGTYEITYWACDAEHLSPATVTVTVRKTPEVTARKTERPGRVRFTNPRSGPVVVVFGGLRQEEPAGRFRLAARSSETIRVARRAIRWFAFKPRTGQTVGDGVVRGIDLPGSASGSGGSTETAPELSTQALRAWRTA